MKERGNEILITFPDLVLELQQPPGIQRSCSIRLFGLVGAPGGRPGLGPAPPTALEKQLLVLLPSIPLECELHLLPSAPQVIQRVTAAVLLRFGPLRTRGQMHSSSGQRCMAQPGHNYDPWPFPCAFQELR